MPTVPKETKEEKRRRIRKEIDASERRKLRREAEAREKEEANKERRAAKARRQGAAAPKPSVRDNDRIPFLLALELTPSEDSLELIKRAYKRLALLYHPDKNPAGEAKMKNINASYAALIS